MFKTRHKQLVIFIVLKAIKFLDIDLSRYSINLNAQNLWSSHELSHDHHCITNYVNKM